MFAGLVLQVLWAHVQGVIGQGQKELARAER